MNNQPSSPSVLPVSESSSSLHVLLIEDDEFQRVGILARLFSGKVDNVCAVQNAEEALEVLKSSSDDFDITLCDLKLHDIDGLEFLLRADFKRLGAIVLHSVLPLDVQQATARLLAQRGVPIAACLPKPLSLSSFMGVARNRFNRQTELLLNRTPEVFPVITREMLLAALHGKEFIAYFQPQINLADHSLYGVECLCRWKHPTLGLLSPSAFLPEVIKHDLIDDLTWHVMDYSLDAMRRWPLGMSRPRVGINVSAASLQGDTFVREWKRRVVQAGFDPSDVTLELTETEVANSEGVLLEILTRLRIFGFGVALDDFGVGNTSLTQLRQLPVTELKVDRTFVSRAKTSERIAVILDAMVYMANELSLCSIAEGVESAADAELLKALGCRVGQGYYFAKPMSFEKLIYWVQGKGCYIDKSKANE